MSRAAKAMLQSNFKQKSAKNECFERRFSRAIAAKSTLNKIGVKEILLLDCPFDAVAVVEDKGWKSCLQDEITMMNPYLQAHQPIEKPLETGKH